VHWSNKELKLEELGGEEETSEQKGKYKIAALEKGRDERRC